MPYDPPRQSAPANPRDSRCAAPTASPKRSSTRSYFWKKWPQRWSPEERRPPLRSKFKRRMKRDVGNP
jgi:hypothetical protein